MKLVGNQKVLRKEGVAKVTGYASYIDDIKMQDMIYGTTIRSTIARGRISAIHFNSKMDWSEFTIVTADDIPGKNAVTLIELDQPFLAKENINHYDEPILLLAHPDRYTLEAAKKFIKIEYDLLPPLFNIDHSVEKKEIIWGDNNVFKCFEIKKGDPSLVWNKAAHIIEGSFETGAQEQLYIENNGMIAVASADKGVTVWGSMQCPYYIHKGLMPLFNLPADQIRVIQTETGGGFGGKEEYPTMLAGHAALLALKSGKPVKMIYSRSEDMAVTTKRHPSQTKIKTAHDKNGKLLAMEIDFTIDGGAYLTLSPVVLSRGTIHAPGPYYCQNTLVRSKAVATNHPPHGAFRGFGAPQSIFALERHLDIAAKKIGITPIEIRKRNFLKKGQTTATGQLIKEDIALDKILDQALKKINYSKKKKQNDKQKGPLLNGVGFATFMHGAGFTGSGEKYLASIVGLRGTSDGKIEVLAGSTEIGQGTNTIFSQIVADKLNLNFEDITVAQPDTANVPNSGPTVASRTCMVVGGLLSTCSEVFRQTLMDSTLLKKKHTKSQFKKAITQYIKKMGEIKVFTEYKQPPGIEWDDKNYRGEAYATYAWAAYAADVTIDLRTYETTVNDFVAVQEVGKVIHPTLAAGQIEGGIAQGIGYAIYEKVVYKDGQVKNNQMTNYIMPTSLDVPPIRVFFIEKNKNHGPFGAKGIGELPMDGPGPAILNAMDDALKNTKKLPLTEIPLLPEDLHGVLEGTPL